MARERRMERAYGGCVLSYHAKKVAISMNTNWSMVGGGSDRKIIVSDDFWSENAVARYSYSDLVLITARRNDRLRGSSQPFYRHG